MGPLRRLRAALRDRRPLPEVVVLTEVTTEAEARLLVGMLQANGIPADTPPDSTDLYVGLPRSRHRVLVRAEDLPQAQALLAEAEGRDRT